MTEFDDFASGKLPQDKLSESARGEPISVTEEFLRHQKLSTAEKTIRDYLGSPSMKLAHDYADSPVADWRASMQSPQLPSLPTKSAGLPIYRPPAES